MTKEQGAKSKENKPPTKSGSKSVGEASHDPLSVEEFPADPFVASCGCTIDGQTALLGDRRLGPGQRQQLAWRIGQLQGNQHLQRVIKAAEKSLQPPQTSTAFIQRSYDSFQALPVPRARLYQEIESLSLEEVNRVLDELGTSQEPGPLWQRIEARYVSGTARRVYTRLIARRDSLQQGEGGTAEEAPAEEAQQPAETAPAEEPGGAGSEESSEESDRRDQRQVFTNIPCNDWDTFRDVIRERISRIVMSRTPGPGGEPVRREVSLTEDNASLRSAFDTIQENHREDMNQGWDVIEDVSAVFHYVGGRVESITFSAPRREGDGEQEGPAPRSLTVTFGVGGLTMDQLTSRDVDVMTDVFLRFERQYVVAMNLEHSAGMENHNVPPDFFDQIDQHRMNLEGPEGASMVVETTVRATPGEVGEAWPCRIVGMTGEVSQFIGREPPEPGEDPGEIERSERLRSNLIGMGISFVTEIIPEVFGLLPVGAFISAGQQTWALIEFNREYLYYAYRQGFWQTIQTPIRNDPDQAIMNSSDRDLPDDHQRRVWISEHFQNGRIDGTLTRADLYRESWQRIYARRGECSEEGQARIEHFNQPGNEDERRRFISNCLNHQYRTERQRQILIDQARG